MRKTIHAVHPAHREDIGDLRTWSPLPGANLPMGYLNPFLLLNHHGPQTYGKNNSGLPFAPHPHRGFETVTFVLEGELLHRDTGGHESVVKTGGVQWMTTGRGLIHEEISSDEFKRDGGDLEILQLWVNLPAARKMTAPAYTELTASALPAFEGAPGAHVHLVSGSTLGRKGPIASETTLLWSTLEAGAALTLVAPEGDSILLYVIDGEVEINARHIQSRSLVEFTRGSGTEIFVRALNKSTILFGHAPHLDEPIAARGPFVMNTPAEIQDAIRDYQSGRLR